MPRQPSFSLNFGLPPVWTLSWPCGNGRLAPTAVIRRRRGRDPRIEFRWTEGRSAPCTLFGRIGQFPCKFDPARVPRRTPQDGVDQRFDFGLFPLRFIILHGTSGLGRRRVAHCEFSTDDQLPDPFQSRLRHCLHTLDRPCGARPLTHHTRRQFSRSNEARNSGDHLSIRGVMRVRKVHQTDEFAHALFKG